MVTGLAILGALIAIMASERAAQAIGRGLDASSVRSCGADAAARR